MATSTTTRAPSATPKMQPPPPRIRTSSVDPTTSSSSSFASKRPPSLPKQQSITGPNSASTGRPQRVRKDTHRVRSVSRMPADGATGPEATDEASQPPLVRDDEYILRKFKGCRPSLVIHLNQTHWRFDQQDGQFTYQSPMKTFLEHLKRRTVPHDMLEELHLHNVSFYDGCLVVEVHDHRTRGKQTTTNTTTELSNSQDKAFSIHKSNVFLTPSPYINNIPYPSPASTPEQSPNSGQIKIESNSNTPSIPQEKVFTRVLHPTQQSHYRDLLIEATTALPDSRSGGKKSQAAAKENSTPLSAYPPTPMSSVAPTPIMSKGQPPKPQRMRLEEHDVHQFEADVLRREEPMLLLEPAGDFEASLQALQMLQHPLHIEDPPKNHGRKRTHAELEADEAAAAEEERLALICDTRLNALYGNAASGAAGVGDGHDTSTAVDMTFNRFKRIEDIKTKHAEERMQRALEEQRRESAKKEQMAQDHHKAIQEKQQNDFRRQQQEQQMAAELKRKKAQADAMPQNQTPLMRNNLMQQQAMQNLRMQQSHGQQSSPIMAPTPGMGSSPIVGQPMSRGGGPPMSANGSQHDMNSPRPGSALQMHQNVGQPMARQTSQQQSHLGTSRTSTPQMPNMTPHMPNTMPAQNMTPQMHQGHQGSPPMGNMQNFQNMTPQQRQHLMMQNPQYMAMMQQRQAQAQRLAQGQQQQNAMNHMSPQQQAAIRAQQAQQGNQAGMMNNGAPNAQNMNNDYRQQLMAQMRAQQQQGQQPAPNATPSTSSMPFNPNMPTANNMARHPSQQPFPQGNVPTPHMQHGSPPQNQPQQHQNNEMPNQYPANPQLAQQQAQAQAQFNQMQSSMQLHLKKVQDNAQSCKSQYMQKLASSHGGQLPPTAEQQFNGWVKQQVLVQRQKFVQQQQMQQHGQNMQVPGQGQNTNMAMNMNASMPNNMPNNMNMMRQGMNPNGQNQQFNAQMSPPQNMMPNMPNNMQGMNVQPMNGQQNGNMAYAQQMHQQQQINHAQARKVAQLKAQQEHAARARANGMMNMNGNGQMHMGMQPGMPGQAQGQGRGGG